MGAIGARRRRRGQVSRAWDRPRLALVHDRATTRPVHRDIENLLRRMTLAEKVAQLGGATFSALQVDGDLDEQRLQALLGHGIGHVSGIALGSGGGPAATAAITNDIQRFLLERTRLGIPAL